MKKKDTETNGIQFDNRLDSFTLGPAYLDYCVKKGWLSKVGEGDNAQYELTELGRSLEPVVLTLSRWGARLAADLREDDESRPAWAATALVSLFEPGAGGRSKETYEFRIDREAFHLRIGDGAIEARQGPAEAPDAVVAGSVGTFISLAAGRLSPEQALKSGEILVEGADEARARCLKMLGSAGTS